MKRTLFFHIGGPKTGSSSLQDFLSRNRTALRARGFFYPGTLQAHREICGELEEFSLSRPDALSRTCIRKWMRDLKRSQCHTHILSAECLAGLSDVKKLQNLVPSGFHVKVVYYARRQDNLIESWYNEVVKSRNIRLKEKLDEDLVGEHIRKGSFDHLRVVTAWAEAFGRENIIVRCFEKQQMPGGIIQDFSGVIGLPVDSSLWIPAKDVNKSLDVPHTEFIRLCNNSPDTGQDMSVFLYWGHFQHSRIRFDLPKRHLLSPETRRKILESNEESNRRVAREYLGREDGRLFFDPWPDPDEPWEPYNGLTVEELVPIIAELIYEQGRREQAGQPLQTMLGFANQIVKKIPGITPRGNPVPVPGAGGQEPELRAPCSVEELVPRVSKILYLRQLRARERQPLDTVFGMVNRILARVVSGMPVWKRKRLGRKLGGRGPDHG